MSLATTLRGTLRTMVDWLVRRPSRFLMSGAHWRSRIRKHVADEGSTVIVIGVRPGGFIHEEWAKAHKAKKEAEGRAD